MIRRRPPAALPAVLGLLAYLLAATPAHGNRLITIKLPTDHVVLAEEPIIYGDPDTPVANVLLPDGYDRHKRRGYPVLYLLHGANGNYRTWEARVGAGIKEIADGFRGIIVMPDGGGYGMYSDWYNRGEFGRPRWMSFHLRDMLRTIERRFPIRRGRRWHAIAGVSMGGQGAVRYAEADPSYFGTVVGISPTPLDLRAPETIAVVDAVGALTADGTIYEDIWGSPLGQYAAGNNPLELIPNLTHTRVYITSGDGTACPGDELLLGEAVTEIGLRGQVERWVAAARAAGVQVTSVRTCGAHTQTEARAFEAAREWGYFRKPPRRSRTWEYVTIADRGRAPGLRFRFATQPAEIARFSRRPGTLRAEGSGEVQIRHGRHGCKVTASLPFSIPYPPAC